MSPSTRAGIRWLCVIIVPLLVAGAIGRFAAEEVRTPKGQARRAAWTTSRVVGSPEPPAPFKTVRAFPNLKFDHPVVITHIPGSNRMVIGEQSGRLYSFIDRPEAKSEPFLDLPREIQTLKLHGGAKGAESVYGITFHPNFARNRQCFLCYTLRPADPGVANLKDGTRVSRFRVTESDPPRIDPASEEVLITFQQGGHNGGDIHFGPDGMLYISSGDSGNPNPPDPFNTGQDISDLLSSILRIDVDRKDAGKTYAIPKDNPFVAREGARPEVWAYGLRNPWRFGFDRKTGELFAGDVGWERWDMVHRIQKGGNYGWSAKEGTEPVRSEQVGPTPILPPLIELPHSIACSITGGFVYRGKKLPELVGAYIFGDWETRRLWAARFEGDRVKEMPELTRPSIRIVAFGENLDGELYILDHDEGTIQTLERNDAGSRNANFPAKLSDTGLFASVKGHKPAQGVIPFKVNSRQWHDGASEEHWAAFPGQSAATLHANGKPVPGLVSWHAFRMHFPKDAVLVRTLSLAGRRMETQLLHFDGADWRAYTFAWRDDQSDADLVPAEGSEREVNVSQGRKRVWQFASRGQCMSCHSNQSEYALAFLPEQLNGPGSNGRNQLVSLTESGIIQRAGDRGESLPPFNAASVSREPRVVDPSDERQPLEARARSYLHANCGHCHSEHGGGSVPLRLKFPTPINEMHAVNIRATRGDFGLPDARIIKPKDPYASTLYFRMAKFGRDRMPHIGSEQPDEKGLDLIERWITAMVSEPRSTGRPSEVARRGGASDPTPSDPRSSQILARKLGRGEIDSAARTKLLSSVAKLPRGPIRDLFEGYLPSDGRKTLGSNPRPAVILALQGDHGRGTKLFWSQTVRCGECHRVGDRGTVVGPDLSAIGKSRSRESLLESLLEPSRRIEPAYAGYSVMTKDGQALAGILVKRDESRLALRDSQGKDIIIAANDLEQIQPSRVSLMPDGQLADLTPQEVADLLAYLTSLKGG